MDEQEKGFSLNDMLFVALVRDFESMAMVGFGKLVDPVSQKAERNMERAKVAIDMLGMLEGKTKGNLNDTEVALMQQVLTNLRLNYVDELEKEKAAEDAHGGEVKAESAEPAGKAQAGHGEKDDSEQGAKSKAGEVKKDKPDAPTKAKGVGPKKAAAKTADSTVDGKETGQPKGSRKGTSEGGEDRGRK